MLKKTFPSDALCKAAQAQRAASCWTAKYLFRSGTEGTLVLWFCVSFIQLLSLVSNFSGGGLRSARGMCPSADRASCTRGQRSGKLSVLLSEKTQTDRRTWIIPFLTTWPLLWRSLFRLQWPCWCLQFFFLSCLFYVILQDNVRLLRVQRDKRDIWGFQTRKCNGVLLTFSIH